MAAPTRAPVAALVAVLLLAGACSDGDDGEGSAADTTTTSTAAATGGSAASSSTTASTASTAAPEKELTAASRARLDGIGPIVMGMTLAQATAAVGRTVAVMPDSLVNQDDTDTCGFADVEGGPEGLAFMVNRDGPGDDWVIVRLDVATRDSPVATGAGIRVGATEDEVERAYGDRLRTEPHHYTADSGGHYLILDVDGAGGMRLLFETDGRKVVAYRSGFESAVDAVEGCL